MKQVVIENPALNAPYDCQKDLRKHLQAKGGAKC